MLSPKSAIPREFELIAVQSHPRSSVLVAIETAYATSWVHVSHSLIVTMDVHVYLLPFLRYWRLNLENVLFSYPSFVWRPAWRICVVDTVRYMSCVCKCLLFVNVRLLVMWLCRNIPHRYNLRSFYRAYCRRIVIGDVYSFRHHRHVNVSGNATYSTS